MRGEAVSCFASRLTIQYGRRLRFGARSGLLQTFTIPSARLSAVRRTLIPNLVGKPAARCQPNRSSITHHHRTVPQQDAERERARNSRQTFDTRTARKIRNGTIQYDDAEIPQGSRRYLAAGHRTRGAEENLAGKGKLKVKMVLTGEGTGLNHVVEGEIDLSDAHF